LRLAADLTGGYVDEPVAGELLGAGNGLLDVVDEGETVRCRRVPVRRRPMGDDEDVPGDVHGVLPIVS
jgi:hypothetical protein